LEEWADGGKGTARTASRNILEAFYAYTDFCDCPDRNSNKNAQFDFPVNAKEEVPLHIEASPNPATHYVEFFYELSEIDTEGIITITDMSGKTIETFRVEYAKGLKAWDTRNIPAGSYIVSLKTNYFEKSEKLIIQ